MTCVRPILWPRKANKNSAASATKPSRFCEAIARRFIAGASARRRSSSIFGCRTARADMETHRATPEEHAQGYAICGCEKYAFVWKADWVRWFPPGYHGELCPECQAWMCSVEK